MIERLFEDVPSNSEKAPNSQESSDWVLDTETFEWLLGARVRPAPSCEERDVVQDNKEQFVVY